MVVMCYTLSKLNRPTVVSSHVWLVNIQIVYFTYQTTIQAENAAGEARSTADLVVRPIGTEPGAYFHVTKVCGR